LTRAHIPHAVKAADGKMAESHDFS